MVRTASGQEPIEAANLLKTARTADELRLAQSVLLPLELELGLRRPPWPLAAPAAPLARCVRALAKYRIDR